MNLDELKQFIKQVCWGTLATTDDRKVDALADTEYHDGMIAYGRNYDQLSRKVWEEHYMAKEAIHS